MKITTTMFLHWQQPAWKEDATFVLYSTDMSACLPNCALVGEREVTVDVPDNFDPRPGMVDGLKQKKNKVLADAQMEATKIDGQIQQLLAIECKPEAQ